jgi:thrombospondin type 3 repeat protein
MKRLIVAAVSLCLGLGGLNGSALAQTNSGLVVIDDASGTDGTNPLRGNCEMSGSGRDRLVTCTDLRPGRGVEVTDSPAETAPVATEVTPAPAPSAEEATAPETTETAVATLTDQDADNFDDALEPEAGLDPTLADTDGDYVADGDEFALYQTDPTLADTDGDGALDGEELFGTHTNPLLWEEGSATAATGDPAASSEPATEAAPAAAPVAETTTPAETTAPVAADTTMSDKEAAYLAANTAPPPAGTTENLSATSTSLLGPDGTYRVSESSPPIITVSGETTGVSVVLAPSLEPASAAVAEPTAATETAEPVESAAPVESADPVAADTTGA